MFKIIKSLITKDTKLTSELRRGGEDFSSFLYRSKGFISIYQILLLILSFTLFGTSHTFIDISTILGVVLVLRVLLTLFIVFFHSELHDLDGSVIVAGAIFYFSLIPLILFSSSSVASILMSFLIISPTLLRAIEFAICTRDLFEIHAKTNNYEIEAYGLLYAAVDIPDQRLQRDIETKAKEKYKNTRTSPIVLTGINKTALNKFTYLASEPDRTNLEDWLNLTKDPEYKGIHTNGDLNKVIETIDSIERIVTLLSVDQEGNKSTHIESLNKEEKEKAQKALKLQLIILNEFINGPSEKKEVTATYTEAERTIAYEEVLKILSIN